MHMIEARSGASFVFPLLPVLKVFVQFPLEICMTPIDRLNNIVATDDHNAIVIQVVTLTSCPSFQQLFEFLF